MPKRLKDDASLKRDMHYKSTSTPIKDIDEVKGFVAGYFSTKNVRDSDGDIIVDGAFTKTVRERGPEGTRQIKTLYQHNPAWLLATPSKLVEDDMGLYYENTISRTHMGQDVIKLIMDEVLTEHSIGFSYIDWEWDDERDVMLLKEVKLYEGSYVTWGSNSLTPILEAKGTDYDVLTERLETIEKALRKGTWHTEEIPTMFEIFVKQMRPVIKELRSNVKPIEPSTKDTRKEEDVVIEDSSSVETKAEPEFTLEQLWREEMELAQKKVDIKSIWAEEFEELRISLGGTVNE